jgi:hypothetical protein
VKPMKRNPGKRLLTLALVAATLCLPAGPRARAETATMAEYRETVPDSVRFVIDGQTYDVPVSLPDEDTLPVIVVQMATFDSSMSDPAYDPSIVAKGCMSLCRESSANRLYGKTDSTDREALPEGATPPDNDVTPEEILSYIQDSVVEFHYDMQADLRLVGATAMSGLYRTKRVKASDGNGGTWTEFAVYESKPVKNKGKGSWEPKIVQYLHGAQILGEYYPGGRADVTPEIADSSAWWELFSVYVSYMDEDNFNILYCLAKETGVVAENTELLPFDQIVQRIRDRIDEGNLKSIYRLTLGYTVTIVKGDACYDGQYDYDQSCRYVLVPQWSILGYDLKDASGLAQSVAPSREVVLDPAHHTNGERYELRLDAASGEPVLDYDALTYDLDAGD